VVPAFSQTIKVMTYNIRFDNPKDGINAWPSRKQKVVDLIRKYNPDMLGVQEALHHQLEELTQALDGYAYIGVGRDDGQQKGEYSAILYKTSRFKLLESNTFWLSETPEEPGSKSWDAAITRVVTYGTFSLIDSDFTFFLANTHFDHIGTAARKQSAELLMKKLPALSDHHPVILTGDFNCERNDAPYHVLTKPGEFTLHDPAPEKPEGTFCDFAVGKMTCRAIDYIFFTPHWKSSAYVVIDDNDGIYYPSDHLPVMVTLNFMEP